MQRASSLWLAAQPRRSLCLTGVCTCVQACLHGKQLMWKVHTSTLTPLGQRCSPVRVLSPDDAPCLTWGTPSQSSACCMASRAFCTGSFGSHSAQSGHKPARRGRAGDQISTNLEVTLMRSLGYSPPCPHDGATRPNLHCSAASHLMRRVKGWKRAALR